MFDLQVTGFSKTSGELVRQPPTPAPVYPYFARILADYERTSDHRPRTHGAYPETVPSVDYRKMKDYKANAGMPDQMNLFDDLWFELRSDKQWLWMDVCCLSQYGRRYADLTVTQMRAAKAQWASLTDGGRCFTNGTGWNNGFRDWVQPKNTTAAKGVQQEQVVCSLNTVKVIGAPKTINSNYLGLGAKPYLHYPIECVNPARPLPTPEVLLAQPWLCHKPTVSTGKHLGGGVYEIDPFPQFDEKSRYILWGKNGIGWIRADWIIKL